MVILKTWLLANPNVISSIFNMSCIFFKYLSFAMLCLFAIPLTAQQNLTLWYHEPANNWEETLPLGNGRLGMTPDGNTTHETIVLNDITLWSGSVQDANNYDAHKSLPKIRQLILEGKNDEAQ